MIKAVLILMFLAGGYWLYSSQANKDMDMPKDMSMTSTESSGPESSPAMAESMAGDVRVIMIEGGNFAYKPDVITIKKGEKVKVMMKSVDMMHDFVIDELNVKSKIAKNGDTAEVEFMATEVGKFEFYCSVGSHRAKGMIGTLIVTE
jgi:plastocyanin